MTRALRWLRGTVALTPVRCLAGAVVLTFASTPATQAQSTRSRWLDLGGDSTSDLAIDRRSIVRTGDVAVVWIRTTYASDSVKIMRVAFDCQRRMERLDAIVVRDTIGTTLHSTDFESMPNSARWFAVSPESRGEEELEAACALGR